MGRIPATGRSDYLAALASQIERMLQRALGSRTHRVELLQELMADIALEVDDRAREIMLRRSDNDHASEVVTTGNFLCFYNLLADYFVQMPNSGWHILDLIDQLWSQSYTSHIFALLFHKWLFEAPLSERAKSQRYGAALVQGATHIFWVDIQTDTRRFLSLFEYLLENVSLHPERVSRISPQAGRDLFLLLSRFILFYDKEHVLGNFLNRFPDFPNAFFVGRPEDYFIIELTDQLQKLKVEPVLIHYLERMYALQGLELRMATSTRLKACLYSFTSPGGPTYPTRSVRHAAWRALDILFPVGRYPRHIISLFFRLLYPWYWPSSCWNFIVTCVRTLFLYIMKLIQSSWRRSVWRLKTM